MKSLNLKQLMRWLGLGLLLAVAIWFTYSNFVQPQLTQRRQEKVIRGMAEDFPKLAAQFQIKGGVEMNITSSCFQTQEKFSTGVSSCRLLAVGGEDAFEDKLRSVKELILSNPFGFGAVDNFNNDTDGYSFYYKDVESCSAVYENPIYLDCRVGYSEANAELIGELLNEDRLNQKKNEYLKVFN